MSDLPHHTSGTAEARPYRPSNGAEGMDFMAVWCDRCQRDAAFQAGTGDSCPIAAATLVFDVTDPRYPPEWIEDASGIPRCTAFEALSQTEAR